MGWLDGRVALVTGGGSGIGRAVVQRFIEEGAHVCVLGRSAERAQQLEADFGDAVVAVQGDVRRLDDNKHAAENCREGLWPTGHIRGQCWDLRPFRIPGRSP